MRAGSDARISLRKRPFKLLLKGQELCLEANAMAF